MAKIVTKLIQLNLQSMLYSLFSYMSGKKSIASSKKSISKNLLAALMIIFVLMIMLSAFLGFFILAYLTNTNDMRWMYSTAALLAAFLFSIMGSLLSAQSYLFESNDNDLMMSLPLKPMDILLGRAATLYVMNLMYSSMILLPAMGAYGLFLHLLPLNALLFIIIMLIFPLFSTAICSIFAYILWFITSKLPTKKAGSTILGFALMAIVVVIGLNAKNVLTYSVQHLDETTEFSKKYLFIFYWFGKAIADYNVLYTLLIVLISVAAIVLAMWFISTKFIKVLTTKFSDAKKKFVQKPMKQGGINFALIKKELGYFLSMPAYIMNGGFGTISSIIFGIFILLKGVSFSEGLMGFEPATSSFGAAMIMCSVTMMCVINDATASAISLEAKTLWIIKTAPIDYMKIFIAKSLIAPIIALPGILFAVFCGIFTVEVNIVDVIFMILIPMFSTVFAGLLGVCVNLLLPRFDWSSEIIIIKQSGSVIATIFLSLLLSIIPLMLIMITALLVDDRPVILGYIAGLVFFLVLIAGEILFLNTKGRKLFKNLA